MARIIILNGAGSAGKSSIARALQEITVQPYLHVAMDAFLDMLPAAYMDHPDGLTFEPVIENGQTSMAIKSGAVVERALRGMRRAVAALVLQDNNLIVDEVMLGPEMEDYRILLADFDVSLIGIRASLAVLEERERQRGDRAIGLARWQYDRVHRAMKYDLEIDTSTDTPAACALKIKEALGL